MVNATESKKLDDLVGTHVIDGIGAFVVSASLWGVPARVFLLRLDGHVLAFREDVHTDGYSSMLHSVDVLADDHVDVRRVVPFAPKVCSFVKRAPPPWIDADHDHHH